MAHEHLRISAREEMRRADGTLRTMLLKRGYTGVVRPSTMDMDYPPLRWAGRAGGRLILAFAFDDHKFSVTHARDVASLVKATHHKVDSAAGGKDGGGIAQVTAVVGARELTPQGKTELDELPTMGPYRVNVFSIVEIIHDISEHAIQPRHRALSPKETADVLARNHSVLEQYPVLLLMDPLRRFYDWPPGQMVAYERTRMSTIAPSNYYRVVDTAPENPSHGDEDDTEAFEVKAAAATTKK